MGSFSGKLGNAGRVSCYWTQLRTPIKILLPSDPEIPGDLPAMALNSGNVLDVVCS